MTKNYILDWTFPNLGKYYRNVPPIRGSLNERLKDAKRLGLTRIEVPFDLVREENEEYLVLNKKIGDVITKDDFVLLYGDNSSKFEGYYVLHTDPELKRAHTLYWNLAEWRNRYLESIVEFSDFVGKPPSAIEFHPSKPKRSKKYMIYSILEAFDKFKGAGFSPYIMIENRTGMYISTVNDMINFYKEVSENLSPNELSKFGFCIDISQLYTQMRKDPVNDLKKLPKDYILGWHIHYRHKPPSNQDSIGWKSIAKLISETENAFYLPEVFKFNDVIKTIKYIENMLKH